MNSRNTNAGIQAAIAKGWRPNAYLTNMSMAFFQDPGDFVAVSIFPICPVQLSASYFYTFSKADLARDNVQRKPAYGKVQPAIMGQEDNNYKCEGTAQPRPRRRRPPAGQGALRLRTDAAPSGHRLCVQVFQGGRVGESAGGHDHRLRQR